MTTLFGRTLDRTRDTEDPPAIRLSRPPTLRRPLQAVASVALVMVSVAVFVTLYEHADHQESVVVITTPVSQGQRITAGQLGVAEISSSGPVSSIPASEIDEVVGRYAVTAMQPGSLVAVSDVTDTSPLAQGQAVVGVALKAGQLPATGVEPGDRVMVVQTATPGAPAPSIVNGTPGSAASPSGPVGSSGSSGSTGTNGTQTATSSTSTAVAGVLVPDAQVFDVAPTSAATADQTAELVSIEVSSTLAPLVTESAASGQISLVLLPPEGGKP